MSTVSHYKGNILHAGICCSSAGYSTPLCHLCPLLTFVCQFIEWGEVEVLEKEREAGLRTR